MATATAHVTIIDDTDGTSTTHTCAAQALADHMGYFATLLAPHLPTHPPPTPLPPINITIHCDPAVFATLLAYATAPTHPLPPLSLPTLVPLLVSATFLRIAPVVAHALDFAAANLAPVLALPVDLACIDDPTAALLEPRIADTVLATASEPKPALLDRIYALRTARVTADRSTVFGAAFLCASCGLLIGGSPEHAAQVCPAARPRISPRGALLRGHVPAPRAAIDWPPLLAALHAELDSWDRVYWALFAAVHALTCSACSAVFSLASYRACAYHPASFTAASTPAAYPCCHATSPLAPGCATRPHAPHPASPRIAALLSVVETRGLAMAADAPAVAAVLARMQPGGAGSDAGHSGDSEAGDRGKGWEAWDDGGSEYDDDGRSDDNDHNGPTSAGSDTDARPPTRLSRRARTMAYAALVHDTEWTSYIQRDRDAVVLRSLLARIQRRS